MHTKAFHCIERMETWIIKLFIWTHSTNKNGIFLCVFFYKSTFFHMGCPALWLDKLQSDLRSSAISEVFWV